MWRFSLRSLLATSAGYGSAEVAGRFIQFATIFYLVRTCSKTVFGAFGFMLAVQQVVALLGISGIVEMLTGEIAHAKDIQERDRSIRTIHRYAARYRLLWFLLSAAMILIFAVSGGSPYAPSLALAASASGYLLSKFNLESATYQIVQSQRMAIILKILPPVAMNIGGIIAYHFGKQQLFPFFLGSFGGLVAAMAMTRWWSTTPENGPLQPSHRPAELLRRTGPYMVVSILGWLSGYGNNLIIHSIFNASVVAEFTLALTLAMPVFMLCNATNQAWNPKFIELSRWQTKDDLNAANAAASAVQLLIAAIASLMLTSLYPFFFMLVGGNLREYAHVVPYAGLLMLGYVSLHLYYRVAIYYLVARDARRYMLITTVSGLIGIILSVVLMILLKTSGIYFGFIAANIITGIFFSHYARGRWNVAWPISNLILVAAILVPALYLAATVRSSTVLFILNLSGALVLSAAWYKMNRKSLRAARREVL